ncbi:MAG TPA: hypothetical protein V6C91_11060 [Coleofasciculaceae cyanobacterium]
MDVTTFYQLDREKLCSHTCFSTKVTCQAIALRLMPLFVLTQLFAIANE